MAAQELKIGLLGCSTVGRGLLELVAQDSSIIRRRSGVELSITKILVRDLDKERPGVDRIFRPRNRRMFSITAVISWSKWLAESSQPIFHTGITRGGKARGHR
jgi:homoserine dehydrogenase